MWLSLLTNKYVIIGAVVVVAGIYIKILKVEISSCEAEKKNLVAELAISQASVKSLQAAINDQNAAVDKLKTDSDNREKAGAVEIAKAKVTADGFKKQADTLLRRVVPQNTSMCDAANQLINEEINNAK